MSSTNKHAPGTPTRPTGPGSNIDRHAWDELDRAGYFDAGHRYRGALGRDVMELVTTFARQGHSGASAPIAVALFVRLMAGESIKGRRGE